MEIKPINVSNYNPNFGVKFVTNDDFMSVIDYAMKHNKSDKLIEALNNIDSKYKDTIVEMNICYTDKSPTLVFSRFVPEFDKILHYPTGKHILKRQVDYIGNPKIKPLEFALNKLLKMGYNRANNKMFDNVVKSKEDAKTKGFLF